MRTMRARSAVFVAMLAVVGSPGADGARAEARAFAVIVSPNVGADAVTRAVLASIFRRRQLYWADGARVQPVNLPAANALRQAFSECVLGESPDAMESYWRELYFHGQLPPHVVGSEQAVLLFVQSTPGAIGYVAACPKDASVNVVMTFGDPPNCPRHPTPCNALQDS